MEKIEQQRELSFSLSVFSSKLLELVIYLIASCSNLLLKIVMYLIWGI
jgi:hypothetical protein